MDANYQTTNHIMTTLTQPVTHVLLGEVFEYDELRDIAQYGADTGVHGFTYSSDLYDRYVSYETEIENVLEDAGFSMYEVFAEKEFETLQQYREWACWCYLELEASRITDNY